MDKFAYWVRIKEMDGSWTDWREISRERYLRISESWDVETRRTDKTARDGVSTAEGEG